MSILMCPSNEPPSTACMVQHLCEEISVHTYWACESSSVKGDLTDTCSLVSRPNDRMLAHTATADQIKRVGRLNRGLGGASGRKCYVLPALTSYRLYVLDNHTIFSLISSCICRRLPAIMVVIGVYLDASLVHHGER